MMRGLGAVAACGVIAAGLVLGTAGAALAQDQQPRERPGWPCVGRPDPTYFRTAEATGGSVFLFDKSEIGESAALMIATSRHEETIFRAAGSLNEGMHEFSIPVDSAVESVLFSVSLQCLQVADITTPEGAELRANDPGVDYHQFQAGRIVTIAKPTPGAWRVAVSGRGMFFLVVQARTDLTLDAVRFVEPGGRPGHEGLFPIKGSPRRGVKQTLEVGLSGKAHDVSFRFISSQGEPIQTLALSLSPEEGGTDDDRTYVGDVTPTASEFRLLVSGVDARGFPFERVHAPLFTAATSSVPE